MIQRFKTLILLLTVCLSSWADAIGTWTQYPCYSDISCIQTTGNMVYAIASGSLFSYNQTDQEVRTYTDILNDVSITHISWNESAKRLVIVYANQNIDLLSPNGDVLNVSDYYNKAMLGDKTVYGVSEYGNYAYLSTGFGIVKLNVKTGEISDSYNYGIKTTHAVATDKFIYANTTEGILKADIRAVLSNPKEWKVISEPIYDVLSTIGNNVIVGYNGRVFRLDQTTDVPEYIGEIWYTWMEKCGDNLIGGQPTLFYRLDKDLKITAYANQPVELMKELQYDTKNDCYWTAAPGGGVASYKIEDGILTQQMSKILPDGPASNNFWRLAVNDGDLYSVNGAWSYDIVFYQLGSLNILKNGEWIKWDDTGFYDRFGYTWWDTCCMAIDPRDKNHIFVGSRSGLQEYQDGKLIESYNLDNSALEPHISVASDSKDFVLITALIFDEDYNLWVFNNYTETPIKCLTANGEWKSFYHQAIIASTKYGRDIQRPVISKVDGNMWFTNTSWSNSALYRYDYKNDVLTDLKTFENQDGTSIQSARMYGCAEDKEGNIWVNTSVGPLCVMADDIREGKMTLTQHKVPRNDGTNLADYLLNEVFVKVTAVDGMNRKWIGTEGNGVYLISDDCNTELAHFTSENSGLPSNIIYDICIDKQSGRVYISTDKGLCSYMSDAKEPTDDNEGLTDVWAYPNPVTPEYTGMITVVGLEPGCDVKITTSSGHLVNTGTVTGGSYQWNGCDLNGKRVASGVYMVNIARKGGEKGVVTKIAIVR